MCYKELCGHCILEHSEHISFIKGIKNVLEDISVKVSNISPRKMENDLLCSQKRNLGSLETLFYDFQDFFNKKINNYKEAVITNDQSLKQVIDDLEKFIDKSNDFCRNDKALDYELLNLLTTYLRAEINRKNTNVKIEKENFFKRFEIAIQDSVVVQKSGYNFESTDPDMPKVLHWFEWGKRKLNIYDIVNNCSRTIDLIINFKIPSYSRSILIPNGNIYLLGGEEPDTCPRREVFMFD